jgi:hypothetical protein
MKMFFFMGRNPKNRSGVSWKVWKIARLGRSITTYWGPARLHVRKVVPAYIRSATHRFKNVAEAVDYERGMIQSKLTKGYERRTRWR